ncbi:hypothetical protein CDAR_463751 [Caerostris darwini]|uniref:Uncharacterized protein n=1 Tax=Caerostris darwini TaxID=1538125 RepID=A0AAV4MZH4_9ARAC|nr:hypothetical protein CDAR_463751 [Caerostris darwini]
MDSSGGLEVQNAFAVFHSTPELWNYPCFDFSTRKLFSILWLRDGSNASDLSIPVRMRCSDSVPCFFTVHGRHIHNVTGNLRGVLLFVYQSFTPRTVPPPSPSFHRPERSDSNRQQ